MFCGQRDLGKFLYYRGLGSSGFQPHDKTDTELKERLPWFHRRDLELYLILPNILCPRSPEGGERMCHLELKETTR